MKIYPYICYYLFIPAILLLLPANLFAQESDTTNGKLMTFPFAAPAYTPELGPTLIGVMMVSFKTNTEDSLIQRSTTPINTGISLRGSYFVNIIASTFWKEDKFRIFGELRFRNMPDHYWGVGYDNASSVDEGEETTAYRRSFWKVSPQLLWQFRENLFLGLNIDYNRTAAFNVNPLMAVDPDYLNDGERNFNSGLGLILRYDSRDVPVNPWKGMLIDLQAISYSSYFGGDNNFQVYQADFREFQSILRPGSTLAVQLKTRISTGDVPYSDLSMLGSPYDLRGYYLGHYRDRSMVLGIIEYRHQFQKKDGSMSKHGAVAWIGTGSIAPSPEEFKHWIPNAGFGYRFEVQPRMNVRAEIGFGKKSNGFYISFNEAF